MPTPYERYMKGYQMAADLMARKKQLGFQEQGLELRERGQEWQEEYQQAQMDKWKQPEQPDTELEYWLSQNPGKTVTDYWKEKLRIASQFKTYAPTEAARNYQQDIARHQRVIGREEQATGVPQSPKTILEMAKDRAYERKYGGQKGAADDPIEKMRLGMVDDAIKYNTVNAQAIEKGYMQKMTVPSAEEMRSMLGQGGKAGAESQSEEAAYNACRAAGGTAEECKAKLGIK